MINYSAGGIMAMRDLLGELEARHSKCMMFAKIEELNPTMRREYLQKADALDVAIDALRDIVK